MTGVLTYPLLVLWLFSAQSWGGHAGLFTPGWVPHETYYGVSACLTGKAEHAVTLKMQEGDIVCRSVLAPPPRPLAKPIERFTQ